MTHRLRILSMSRATLVAEITALEILADLADEMDHRARARYCRARARRLRGSVEGTGLPR